MVARSRCPAFALAAGLALCSSAARADDGEPAPAEDSYRTLLATSYVLAPFAALAVGGALSEAEARDEGAVLVASSMFLAPAVVHMAHGKLEHGPLAFLGMAGSTAVGIVAGGAIGYAIDSADCDPDEDSDSCDFAGIGGLIFGALFGGVAGYTGFAIYDVTMNGAVQHEQPASDQASLQLWLTPLRAARHEREQTAAPVDGLMLGATLQL
ncbi:MAG TPA: hypothetical protein VMG12_11615 [Polyangiaceae bacterium]|nr:hypothetical protein [Polyangiaceae bacterium]